MKPILISYSNFNLNPFMTSSTLGAFMQEEQANAETASASTLNQDAGQQSDTQETAASATATDAATQSATTTDSTTTQATNTVQDGANAETAQEDAASFTLNLGEKDASQTAQTADTTQQAATQIKWQDAIKDVDLKEVAAAIGIDPLVVGMIEHHRNGGDLTDYLTAKAVDYTKVSDADLMKQELAKKYPHLEAGDLNYIYDKKYGESEFEDEDVQKGKAIDLKADAYEVRQKMIAEQAKFKILEPTKQQQQEVDPAILQAQQAEQKKAEEQTRFIQNHSATKSLFENKRVVFDFGNGEKFNVVVNDPAKFYADGDGENWERMVSTAQGEPDVEKLQALNVLAHAPNVTEFFKAIFDAGKSAGKRDEVLSKQNARLPNGQPVITATDTPKVVDKNSTMGSFLRAS